MMWMLLYLKAIVDLANIEVITANRQERIDRLDFNPYCRDCDVPEGMDW